MAANIPLSIQTMENITQVVVNLEKITHITQVYAPLKEPEKEKNLVERLIETYMPYIEVLTTCNDLLLQIEPMYNLYKQAMDWLTAKIHLKNKALKLSHAWTQACSVAQAIATGITRLWTKSIDKTTQALTWLKLKLNLSGIATYLYTTATTVAIVATYGFAMAIRAVSKAIQSIPVVGQIILVVSAILSLIGLIIAGFVYLWNHCISFREAVFGVWEVVKNFLGAIPEYMAQLGSSIGAFFAQVWQRMVAFFSSLWQDFTAFFSGIWAGIVHFFAPLSNWFSKNISAPLKKEFGGVWNFITGILDKMMDKLDGLLEPIRKLWKKLFGAVDESWNTGKTKGRNSFNKSKGTKTDAPGAPLDTLPKEGMESPVFPQLKRNNASTPPKALQVGGITPPGTNLGNGGESVNRRIGEVDSSAGKATNNYITLGSLVESLTIQSAGLKEGAEEMKEVVVKTLLEVLNAQNRAVSY